MHIYVFLEHKPRQKHERLLSCILIAKTPNVSEQLLYEVLVSGLYRNKTVCTVSSP